MFVRPLGCDALAYAVGQDLGVVPVLYLQPARIAFFHHIPAEAMLGHHAFQILAHTPAERVARHRPQRGQRMPRTVMTWARSCTARACARLAVAGADLFHSGEQVERAVGPGD